MINFGLTARATRHSMRLSIRVRKTNEKATGMDVQAFPLLTAGRETKTGFDR